MALKEFLKYIFDNKNVNSITLSVFDSNKVAKNLYEKQGFIIEKQLRNQKLKIYYEKIPMNFHTESLIASNYI